MKAQDLDYETDCDVCGGDGKEPNVGNGNAWGGKCPACRGNGTINRYDKDTDEVILKDEYEPSHSGDAFIKRRVHYPRDKFETIFGDSTEWTPPRKENLDDPENEEVTEERLSESQKKFLDRVANKTKQASRGPNPQNENLTPEEAVEFAQEISDETAADALEHVRNEIEG